MSNRPPVTSLIQSPPVRVQPDTTLRFVRILRSEWIKLTSLRSSLWSIVLLVVSIVGPTLLLVHAGAASAGPERTPAEQTVAAVTAGVLMAQIVAAVLGVLSMTGEYSTGMIQSTLAAVPRRIPVLAAKALVLFVLVSVVSAVSFVIAWAVSYPSLAAENAAVGLGEHGLTSAVLGSAASLGLLAVFALAVGALLRSAAGGVAVVLGLLLAAPTLLGLAVPLVPWLGDVYPFLISQAALSTGKLPDPSAALVVDSSLTPWLGGIVVLAWAAVSATVAGVLLRLRDA